MCESLWFCSLHTFSVRPRTPLPFGAFGFVFGHSDYALRQIRQSFHRRFAGYGDFHDLPFRSIQFKADTNEGVVVRHQPDYAAKTSQQFVERRERVVLLMIVVPRFFTARTFAGHASPISDGEADRCATPTTIEPYRAKIAEVEYVAVFNGHRVRFLPRRSCGLDFSARFRQLLAGEGDVGKTFAEHACTCRKESAAIGVFAIVESVHLFIEVAE